MFFTLKCDMINQVHFALFWMVSCSQGLCKTESEWRLFGGGSHLCNLEVVLDPRLLQLGQAFLHSLRLAHLVINKNRENPSFSSIQILVDFIPVASELFHHIWQHWPTACASSCLDICMHLVCLNPHHRIQLIAFGLTWPFSQAVSALSLSLWISPC